MKSVLFCTHRLSPFYKTIPRSLSQLGFTVSIFDYYQPTLPVRLIGAADNFFHIDPDHRYFNAFVNEALRKRVMREKPDYFLTTKALNITNETVEHMNTRGVITINWFQDLLEFLPWIKEHASSYQFFFTPDPYLQRVLAKQNLRSHLLPLAAYPDNSLYKEEKRYDIVFTGQYTKRRERLFLPLNRYAEKFHIWGYKSWQMSRLAGHYHGVLPNIDAVYQTIRQSKIVVNVQTAEEKYPTDIVNLRVYETTGVGTFLLNWYHPSIDKFFKDGQEIVNFKNPNDLLKKAQYYLTHDNEREKIALAGWKRTKRQYTYVHRLKKMFSIVDQKR